MGKKRIASQITQPEKSEKALERAAGKQVAIKKFETGRIYINASYNNTLITVTDNSGNVVSWLSAGTLGFSGPKKATPFAASKIIAALAERIKKSGPFKVDVFVSGISAARDTALRSLPANGFEILSINDVTPVPHNGPRPPKVRRV